MSISNADLKAALEILRNAQFVYGLSRYPKKQVLDDPIDVKTLRGRLEAMRAAAKGLSAAQREKLDVPWADLEAIDSGTEAVWKAAKRATPTNATPAPPRIIGTPPSAAVRSRRQTAVNTPTATSAAATNSTATRLALNAPAP